MYNWETGGNHVRSKRAKKTGTVVFHRDPQLDTTFAGLLKEHSLRSHARSNRKQAGDDEDTMGMIAVASDRTTAPFMTDATAKTLTSPKGPFQFDGLLPSQAQCYRGVFKGRDVILHSRTGSGKTLAYALPIIERHLIFGLASSPQKGASTRGPFMLIFVFSNELAFQTKSVLDGIYGKRGLHVAVAGMDDVHTKAVDILIGTVPNMDAAIRGKDAPLHKRHPPAPGAKRPREERAPTADMDDMDVASDDSDEINADSDDDDATVPKSSEACVSVAQVRAVVVDEVDMTLGPRFSAIGRRMRALLQTVRRANGSLQPSRLMQDFRVHHYILCGATIPNWVIKAGFLGVKKYYYQLVEAGQQKLPAGIECFLVDESTVADTPDMKQTASSNAMSLQAAKKAHMLCELIGQKEGGWGRIVVFGSSGKQVDAVERVLLAAIASAKGDKKAPSGWAAVNGVRSISPSKDELERIRNMTEFNERAANILLCTDIACRGLDFADVSLVVMLALPAHKIMGAETFVHRAGRTARANTTTGRCVSFVNAQEESMLIRSIESATHTTFKWMPLPRVGASASGSLVSHILTVKSAFGGATGASKGPESVLERELRGKTDSDCDGCDDLFALLVQNLTTLDTTRVQFDTPLALDHVLTKRLWKYNLKTVRETSN